MELESDKLIFQLNKKVFAFDTECMEINDVKLIKGKIVIIFLKLKFLNRN